MSSRPAANRTFPVTLRLESPSWVRAYETTVDLTALAVRLRAAGDVTANEHLVRFRSPDAELVVFDNDLSPNQGRNIQKAVGEDVRVLDRTELILDIFVRHAQTGLGQSQRFG